MDRDKFYKGLFTTGDKVWFQEFSSSKEKQQKDPIMLTVLDRDGDIVQLTNFYWLDLSTPSISYCADLNTPSSLYLDGGFIVVKPTTPDHIIGEGIIYPTTEEIVFIREKLKLWKKVTPYIRSHLHPDITLDNLKEVAKLLKIPKDKLEDNPTTIDVEPITKKRTPPITPEPKKTKIIPR